LSALLTAGLQANSALAIACYCGARAIIAAMYLVSKRKHHDRGGVATSLGLLSPPGRQSA